MTGCSGRGERAHLLIDFLSLLLFLFKQRLHRAGAEVAAPDEPLDAPMSSR